MVGRGGEAGGRTRVKKRRGKRRRRRGRREEEEGGEEKEEWNEGGGPGLHIDSLKRVGGRGGHRFDLNSS